MKWLTLIGAVLAACSGDNRKIVVESDGSLPNSDPCPEGTLACRCDPSNQCTTSGSTALVCDRGWCVPETCAPGSEGCACYANGTCDAKDGVPMTCGGNVCAPTVVPDPGTLGGSCADTPCAADLVCIAERCEDPACPSGTLGCPCASFGQCGQYAGEDLRCESNVCVRGTCDPGTAGCACNAGACATGFACESDVCVSTGLVRLVLASATAEACDVRLVEDSATPLITRVDFPAEVRGHAELRSPDAALAFFAKAPGPLASSSTAVALLALNDHVTTAPRIVSAACYDAGGRPLAPDQYALTLE